MRILKYLRLFLALAIFLPITLFFVDFLGILPLQIHGLLHYQLIPAAMHLNVVALVVLLVSTLLFGRLYCSVLCPTGVLQDIFFRISGALLKEKHKSRKKKKEKMENLRANPLAFLKVFLLRRPFYTRPTNWLRYSLLGLSLIGLVIGAGYSLVVLDLLDPYSNFGRVASNLFRPLAILINNGVAEVFNYFNNYAVFKVKITTIEWVSFGFSTFFLLVVFVLSFTRGRIYCNTVCPVGTFLGLLSRFSLFKITIDGEQCTSCGKCEFKCKAQCIDSEAKRVDNDRCVVCFNCLSRCKQKSIGYEFSWPTAPKKPQDEGRRTFLAITGTMVATTVAAQHRKRERGEKREPIMPPGAGNRERFIEKCTACQLCVTKCPSHVLKPALLEYGAEGIMHPRMDFSHGFCNFDCVDCLSVCPNDALQHITKEEKKLTQVGIVKFKRGHCVVVTDGTSCGACSEHCPTQAVHMVDYKDGLTIPAINEDICIGCGGCESICPVTPQKAIFVQGSLVQKLAEKPVEEEHVVKKVDDFGF